MVRPLPSCDRSIPPTSCGPACLAVRGQDEMQTSYLRGVLFCLVATVSWGCMFPVMTSALTQMDPFNFTAIRYTIAAIPFAVLLLAREGKGAFNLKGERHLLAWLFGTAGFAGFGFLMFLGQQLAGPTGALSAAIMTATMPLLALAVNWVMRGVRPPLYSIGFILLAFVGVVLVITKGNPLGAFDQAQSYIVDITLFVGALCWVIYTSGASFFPTWSPYRYTAMTTLLGLVSMYAINVVLIELRYILVPSSGQAWTIMPQFLYMSLVAGAIGVLSWNMGNKIITPVNGVLFINVVPVAAFAVSALSGIVPTPVQLAGAAITVAALVMNNLYHRQRVQRESASPYGHTAAANRGSGRCPGSCPYRLESGHHLRPLSSPALRKSRHGICVEIDDQFSGRSLLRHALQACMRHHFGRAVSAHSD